MLFFFFDDFASLFHVLVMYIKNTFSRASKSAAGDSWLSSDEDDGLQLSPKVLSFCVASSTDTNRLVSLLINLLAVFTQKPQKVNLKKLISSSEKGRNKGNYQNGADFHIPRFCGLEYNVHDCVAAVDTKSWSESESDAENDDRAKKDSPPPETSPPLGGNVLPPSSPSPAPFSKPPQMTSMLLHRSRKVACPEHISLPPFHL